MCNARVGQRSGVACSLRFSFSRNARTVIAHWPPSNVQAGRRGNFGIKCRTFDRQGCILHAESRDSLDSRDRHCSCSMCHVSARFSNAISLDDEESRAEIIMEPDGCCGESRGCEDAHSCVRTRAQVHAWRAFGDSVCLLTFSRAFAPR